MMGRWPVHPLPYSDESLSSWLNRLAIAYGYRIDDLLIYDLGFAAMSSEDLDINPPEQLLWKLSDRTGVSFDKIRTLTVQGWTPLLIDEINPESNDFPTYAGGHSLLYPASLRPLQQIKNWVPWLRMPSSQITQGCRICMQENPEPYRRLSWRMSWMMSCPRHGVMLENTYWVTDERMNSIISKPEPAPPEFVELDLLTAQALEKGYVSLPRRKVHGGVWLRLLRSLIDELTRPVSRLRQYRDDIAKIWKRLGLMVRQGVRNGRVPFEMMKIEQQRLLMKAAGVALQMMKDQAFKKKGCDAILFHPFPISQEDIPSVPGGDKNFQPVKPNYISEYELFWMKIHKLLEESLIEMRSERDLAIKFHKFLLGSDPSPKKKEKIDNLFRELRLFIIPQQDTKSKNSHRTKS